MDLHVLSFGRRSLRKLGCLHEKVDPLWGLKSLGLELKLVDVPPSQSLRSHVRMATWAKEIRRIAIPVLVYVVSRRKQYSHAASQLAWPKQCLITASESGNHKPSNAFLQKAFVDISFFFLVGICEQPLRLFFSISHPLDDAVIKRIPLQREANVLV